MKQRDDNKIILVTGAVLVILVILVVVIVSRIGNRYGSNIASVSNQPPPAQSSHTEKETITRLRIQRPGEKGCMEVSPDGSVRQYAVCQEELVSARRLNDAKYIIRLMKLVSEAKYAEYDGTSYCSTYLIHVETESGTRTFCVDSVNGGSGGGGTGPGPGADIIRTIEDIIEEIPQNTPTPGPGVSTYPTPTIFGQPTDTPTPTGEVYITPTPVPTGTNKGFTCDFDENGARKPFAVSGVVCSTDPIPIP